MGLALILELPQGGDPRPVAGIGVPTAGWGSFLRPWTAPLGVLMILLVRDGN